MKLLVIGNPVAGAGGAAARTRALVRALEARGHAVELYTTRAAGDARRRAAECEGDVDCIVAAGGDGTLNEVLNGLAEPGRTPLAPMALGTANMLARHLGVPDDPEQLAAALEHGSVRRIDMCLAGATRFLSVAGVGFDAMVTQALRRRRRGRLGYGGYVLPIASTFARYRPPRFEVALDGGPRDACAFAIACKLPNYGGVLRVAPGARLDAGVIDVCLFERAGAIDLLRAVLPAFRGRLAALPYVRLARAQRLRVDSASPVAVQLDGDHWGTTPVEIEVVPDAVSIAGSPLRASRRSASG